jgi:hypothetical protein
MVDVEVFLPLPGFAIFSNGTRGFGDAFEERSDVATTTDLLARKNDAAYEYCSLLLLPMGSSR